MIFASDGLEACEGADFVLPSSRADVASVQQRLQASLGQELGGGEVLLREGERRKSVMVERRNGESDFMVAIMAAEALEEGDSPVVGPIAITKVTMVPGGGPGVLAFTSSVAKIAGTEEAQTIDFVVTRHGWLRGTFELLLPHREHHGRARLRL